MIRPVVNRSAGLDEKRERVIEAAKRVFLRRGYRHVTMGDIALEAAMSRPALYLVYPSKAEIFAATLDDVLSNALVEVRAAVDREASVDRKLCGAFEVWCVRPYEMVLASPEAEDLLESSRTIAPAVFDAHGATFERIVARQLAPLARSPSRSKPSALEAARLLNAAAVGFKQSARDVAQLRRMIASNLALVIAGLG